MVDGGIIRWLMRVSIIANLIGYSPLIAASTVDGGINLPEKKNNVS